MGARDDACSGGFGLSSEAAVPLRRSSYVRFGFPLLFGRPPEGAEGNAGSPSRCLFERGLAI